MYTYNIITYEIQALLIRLNLKDNKKLSIEMNTVTIKSTNSGKNPRQTASDEVIASQVLRSGE